MADQKQFEDALSRVVHPDYGKNIVELGLITDLAVANGSVAFQLQNTVANTERASTLLEAAIAAVQVVDPQVQVDASITNRARANPAGSGGKGSIAGVRNVIPVASGKGGVGKSTVLSLIHISEPTRPY